MHKAKLFFLQVCKALGLFRLTRWLTRHQLKILCYHGFALADEARFRPKLFIQPALFAERLATLQRLRMQVLPLDEAVTRLYARTLPAHALVITVDDGFHSFYKEAVPLLQAFGYAATVYVTTYYVQHPHPIFRLVVQYLFWKTQVAQLDGTALPWGAHKAIDLHNAQLKEQACWDCIRYGESACNETQRCALCEDLGHWLAVPYADIVQSKMLHLMTPAELRRLAAADIDVELHTHRHRFPHDDLQQAAQEIADNRAALDAWVAGTSQHFCYPSGLWRPQQWDLLQRLHLQSATTCLPGLNTPRTPRYALRRFLDGQNIHALEFEAAVCGLSGLWRAVFEGLSGRVR